MDEPINGLDPSQIVEVRDLLNSLRGQFTIVVSSHILSEVVKTCDRVIVLSKGRLVAEGSAEELVEISATCSVLSLTVRGEKKTAGSVVAKVTATAEVTDLKVQTIDQQTFCLTVESNADVRIQLVNMAVEQGLGVMELKRPGDSMESTLLSLMKSSQINDGKELS